MSDNKPESNIHSITQGHATKVGEFMANLDAGLFEKKLGVALSDVAAAVVDHNAAGEVNVKFTIKRIGNSASVVVAHALSFKRPTDKGQRGEINTTSTPMHIGNGGQMTLYPQDQDDLFHPLDKD